MSDQSNQVVVVTGASGGIGRAVAQAYGARGARVALLARGEQGLAGAAEDVQRAGGTPLVVPTDVSDSDAVFAAVDRIERELGEIDIWVNVAFTSVFSRFEQITPEEFRRVTEVSYLGYVYSTMAALQRMRPRDRGTIVQVGSALAYRGIPLQTAYCGSKHAIQGFHESLRCELLHEKSNVHVTMVQMPAVNTPQFSWVLSRLPRHPQPVPPIYQPEVAARAIAWAAEHPKRELWVGLPTVYTILGEKFASGLMDRYLARTNVKAQQSDTPIVPSHRDDNLQSPPPGDPGAHGRFDRQATGRSPQLWLATHKRALAGAAAGAAALGTVAARGARR
jgi:NAD(P)-dependent dehydrogenase (short-subunit alcohol dehydrogenase family)